MKYHKFQNSTNIKEVGVYPQANIAKSNNPTNFDSPWNVKPNEFPDFVPDLKFTLNPEAKLTDIISAVGISHGYIVNNKVRELLKGLSLPKHAFYPLELNREDEVFKYYWFHFITEKFWDWIDTEASNLYLKSILPSKKHEILGEVNLKRSQTQFISLFSERPQLTAYSWYRVVFNQNFPKFDIIAVPLPASSNIISEDLHHCFLENDITGFEVSDFCEIILSV